MAIGREVVYGIRLIHFGATKGSQGEAESEHNYVKKRIKSLN